MIGLSEFILSLNSLPTLPLEKIMSIEATISDYYDSQLIGWAVARFNPKINYYKYKLPTSL